MIPGEVRISRWSRLASGAGPILGLVLVLGLIALDGEVRPLFFTGGNFKTIIIQATIVSVGALGMTMIIVSGGIDLSVGSAVALGSVVTAKALNAGWAWPAAVTAVVALGGAVGATSGALIARFRLTPFIVTLGAMGMLRGAAKWAADKQTVPNPDNAIIDRLLDPERPDHFFPLPAGVWIALALAVAVTALMRRTVFGRRLFAIGSNDNAARLSGVPVAATRVWTYLLSGCLVGFAGVLQNARLSLGDPTAAAGLELDIIAAVVIGGASLNGGVGSVPGSLLGALTMAVLRSGANQIGWESYIQEILIGGVILIAVGLDQWRQARRAP